MISPVGVGQESTECGALVGRRRQVVFKCVDLARNSSGEREGLMTTPVPPLLSTGSRGDEDALRGRKTEEKKNERRFWYVS